MKEQIFVGREPELERLGGYLDKALLGNGQVCLIVGQARSGKTALVRQFLQQSLTVNLPGNHPDRAGGIGSGCDVRRIAGGAHPG